ncbi:uncharacterized protein ZHAS_00021941 [Anopheles sinensis]|uniref:Uncharacterized protein n=1 Tax=Anopheles sinensis TaxID=74873 RepID=A0A084WT94_ANOSI|nr:uncharacterized protein ZHAS_00021941 [Anopheles sinensis]
MSLLNGQSAFQIFILIHPEALANHHKSNNAQVIIPFQFEQRAGSGSLPNPLAQTALPAVTKEFRGQAWFQLCFSLSISPPNFCVGFGAVVIWNGWHAREKAPREKSFHQMSSFVSPAHTDRKEASSNEPPGGLGWDTAGDLLPLVPGHAPPSRRLPSVKVSRPVGCLGLHPECVRNRQALLSSANSMPLGNGA